MRTAGVTIVSARYDEDNGPTVLDAEFRIWNVRSPLDELYKVCINPFNHDGSFLRKFVMKDNPRDDCFEDVRVGDRNEVLLALDKVLNKDYAWSCFAFARYVAGWCEAKRTMEEKR